MSADNPLPTPILVALEVSGVLERLGISYLIGGSLASSLHGEARSTLDVDVVAAILPGQVAPFTQALESAYYLDADAVQEAVVTGRSFNAIHLASAVKVDFFVAGNDPFETERLRSRESVRIEDGSGSTLYFDSAEHTVLRKLEWFRRGGESSVRQWRDVQAIVRIQGSRLDRAHMEHWAGLLGVTDLLVKLMGETP